MAKNRPGYGKKQSPLNRMIEKGMVKPYVPGKAIRRGWVMCCPFCETYKMAAHTWPVSEEGFQCLGGQHRNQATLDPVICGKFISKETADAHQALYIVEE